MLEIKNLEIAYKNYTVLSNVNLTVKPGEFVAVIGPNAAGKTTFIKALSTLIKPAAGTITLEGRNINTIPKQQIPAILAYLPQQISAIPPFTVTEFIRKSRTHLPHDPAFELYEHIKNTNIDELKNKTVDKLSGGQLQRVLLSSALAQKSKLILLDEPTSALDPPNSIRLYNLLKQKQKSDNFAVIAVTHDINLIAPYADRFIIINKQQITYDNPHPPDISQLQTAFNYPFQKTEDTDQYRVFPSPSINTLKEPDREKTTPKTTDTNAPSKKRIILKSLSLLPILAILPFIAYHPISPFNLDSPTDFYILTQLRIPRTLAGATVGASLAAVGSALQSLLKNPLATPYTLGIASGASIGAMIAIIAGFSQLTTLPALALITGLTMAAGVFTVAKKLGLQNPVNLMLAGITCSIFASALNLLILNLASPDNAHYIIKWQLGNLETVGYSSFLLLPLTIIAIAVIASQNKNLDLISIDPQLAATKGTNLKKTQALVFFASSLATAATLAFAGPIPFVGLLVPHIARAFTGPDNAKTLTLSLIIGAVALPAADTFAAILSPTANIPVGIILALIGAPALIVILHKTRTNLQP